MLGRVQGGPLKPPCTQCDARLGGAHTSCLIRQARGALAHGTVTVTVPGQLCTPLWRLCTAHTSMGLGQQLLARRLPASAACPSSYALQGVAGCAALRLPEAAAAADQLGEHVGTPLGRQDCYCLSMDTACSMNIACTGPLHAHSPGLSGLLRHAACHHPPSSELQTLNPDHTRWRWPRFWRWRTSTTCRW